MVDLPPLSHLLSHHEMVDHEMMMVVMVMMGSLFLNKSNIM